MGGPHGAPRPGEHGKPAPRLRSPSLGEKGEGAEGASEPGEEVVAAAAGDMDNAGKEREAVQLMAEAEKRVKASHSFLRGLFGGNTKIEEACEMYTRAANMFKMAKNWSGMYKVFVCLLFRQITLKSS